MNADIAHAFGARLSALLLATLVLVATAVVARLRPKWPLWLHLLWRFSVFTILTILVQYLLGSPLHPQFSEIYNGTTFWEHIIEAGWWLLAAAVAVSLVRLLVVLEHRPRETQIMSDLLAGAIAIATLLAIVNFVLGVPIAGLLATSGVIAIVLGLALQNTLADVFSGIAVGIERPYQAGDLLWVEGGIEGHVTQVTWRSTHIVTGHGNIAVIPNSVMAKARLVNRSLPVPTRSDSVEITLDPSIPPEHCMEILATAAHSVLLTLATPAPSVSCTGIFPDGLRYSVTYSVASSDMLSTARSEMLSQIHRHLRYAGVSFALATADKRLTSPPPLGPADILAQSDLFGVLREQERDLLASHFHESWMDAGQILFAEGAPAEYLFLIASGVVEITRRRPTGPHVIRRMGPGESLGAIGLITDTPYAATATALTPVKVFRLDKSAIASAIATASDLALALEELAHRSQMVLARDAAAEDLHPQQAPEELRFRLRNFLRLLKH
ncbi:MAG TPA: mechanosensitive ion channel family protein [Acidisoma sp.]|nr:mechanosensitive ion channel family protein [Acidisoma sp.]